MRPRRPDQVREQDASEGAAPGGSPAPANPFPGPRPFAENEHELFFGRERELSDLVALLFAQRAVLLHGPSGGGKSSLIYAGLLPRARERGFEFLPVARVRGVAGQPQAVARNRYLGNVIDTWQAAGLNVPDGASTLTEALSVLPPADEPGRVVVFDQFEELFVFHPERWKDRADLLSQIQAALDHDPLLHVLFVLREDYLARLQPLTPILRDRLSTRYRLRGLGPAQALEAVARPIRATGRAFAPGVAEALVKALRAQPGVAPEDPAYEAEEVEPVQLQIVCRTFFARLPTDVVEIGPGDVERHADVGQALVTFYEQALTAAVKAHPGIHERRVRLWFERQLITPGRTRSIVFRDEQDTAGLPNAVVDALEHRRIVRSEPRGPAQWYELPHDRLIDAVLASNRVWYASRARTVTRISALVGGLGLLAAVLASWLLIRDGRQSPTSALAAAEAEISGPGRTVEFPVSGRAGQILTAIMTPVVGFNGELRVLGPDGAVLRESAAAGSRPVLSLVLPADGDYRVEARGQGSSTGSFLFSSTVQSVDARVALAASGPVPGAITGEDEVDLHTFVGRAGTVAQITMVSGEVDGRLVLSAPGGQVFAEVYPYRDGDAVLAVVLPEDGTYELLASASGADVGSYRLDLEFPDEVARVGTASGTLDDRNRVDLRTLRTDDGGVLDVFYAPSRAGVVILLAADGSVLREVYADGDSSSGEGFTWVMAPGTPYTLLVAAEQSPTPYVLTVGIEEAVPVAAGRAIGELILPGQLALYRIDGEQGDVVTLLVTPAASLDTLVSVTQPDGTRLIDHDGGGAGQEELFTVQLLTTGPHLIAISAGEATQTGVFRLAVTQTGGPVVAPDSAPLDSVP